MTTRRRRRRTRIGPLTNIHKEPEGWSVIVIRRGERFSDYFGNAVFGGKERALLAAQRFRDRLLQRIGPDTRVRRRSSKGRPSKTGVVGVNLDSRRVGGRVYRYYVASWQDPEKGHVRRRFPVERYGREQALALAIKARATGVSQSHAQELSRQREEARQRLREAAPMPRQVKDPRSRKGISMARRRPRRVKGA